MLGVAAVIKKNAPAMKQKAEKLGEDCINACKTVCEDICADPGQNAQSNQNGQSGQNSQSNQSAGQGQ